VSATADASHGRIRLRLAGASILDATRCGVEAAGLVLGNLKAEGDVTLNHTFAEGAQGRGEVLAAHEHERVRPARVEHLALGSITFGHQRENPPLQAADFLAWEFNRRTRQEQTPDQPVPAMRMSLRRFLDVPHRWARLTEDHVGGAHADVCRCGVQPPRHYSINPAISSQGHVIADARVGGTTARTSQRTGRANYRYA
jgi:hypothetical protein